MNEILQQRIEEAAQRCATTTDGKIISFAYLAAKQMADWLLQNQWISVEEALPEYEEDIIVTNGIGEYWFTHRTANNDVMQDEHNFCTHYPSTIYPITHWMSIPSLEGGEK